MPQRRSASQYVTALIARTGLPNQRSASAAIATVGRGGSVTRLWSGVGLMVLAICGLHFTGMAAITLAPDAQDYDIHGYFVTEAGSRSPLSARLTALR